MKNVEQRTQAVKAEGGYQRSGNGSRGKRARPPRGKMRNDCSCNTPWWPPLFFLIHLVKVEVTPPLKKLLSYSGKHTWQTSMSLFLPGKGGILLGGTLGGLLWGEENAPNKDHVYVCKRWCEIHSPKQTNRNEKLWSKLFELHSALPIFLILTDKYKKTLKRGL